MLYQFQFPHKTTMLKLELQVKFIKICCRQLCKQSHPLIIALYNQEGQCLMNGQKKIQFEKYKVQLDSLPSFQLFIVVNQEKKVFNPFSFSLFTQNQASIQRKIALNTDKIVKLYTEDINNPNMLTVDLIQSFDLGQLFYRVSILNAQKILDGQLLNKFTNKFKETQNVLNDQREEINQEFKTQDSNLFYGLSDNLSRKKEFDNKEQLSMHQVTKPTQLTSSIAADENSQRQFQTDFEDDQGIPVNNEMLMSIKLLRRQNSKMGAGPKHQVYVSDQQPSKGLGIKVKMLICLSIIGLLLLIFNLQSAKAGPHNIKLPRKPKNKKTKIK